jgi:hypothetical protein
MEEDTFRNTIQNINRELEGKSLGGRKFPICFKDIYNGYMHERNQVYTRSLHAEENAFLQISKYGGQGIKGGKLFVTASPCELCSKKSYQLGITDIYYIDPYPGIAERHILKFGKGINRPNSHLFYGAIGEAYIALYKPLMAYKDELEMVSGVNCKKIAEKDNTMFPKEPETMDLEYEIVEFSAIFETREKIESTRKVDFYIRGGGFKEILRQLVWTGSSYDGTELLEGDYRIEDFKENISPYHYKIDFGKMLKTGDRVTYKVISRVKDETHLMHPYIAHYVKYPTKKLVLRLEVPSTKPLLEGVRYKRYADKEMKFEYPDKDDVHVHVEKNENKNIYILEIEHPNLFYTYALEWDFFKIKD